MTWETNNALHQQPGASYRIREDEDDWVCHDAMRIKPEPKGYAVSMKRGELQKQNSSRYCLAHSGINGQGTGADDYAQWDEHIAPDHFWAGSMAAGSQRSHCQSGRDPGYPINGTSLAHYGVKGMHWGEITKEYQPVTVDHRKTRGGIFSKATEKIRNQIRADDEEVAKEREDRRARWKARKEKNEKIMKYMAAAGALLLIYGGYRHFKLTHLPGTKTGLLKELLQGSVSPMGIGPALMQKRKENGVKNPEFITKATEKVKSIGMDFVKSVAGYREKRRGNKKLGGLKL